MNLTGKKSKLSESILEELWFGEDDPQATDAQAAASFAARLADLEGLRPFSDVSRRVLEYVSNPDFEVGRLQDILEQDPALATKILRTANSAAFRPREPCSSIRQAIMVLGSKTLGEVAASLSLMATFSDLTGVGRAVRDHCAATGAIVRALALRKSNAGAGSYIVGLLHDFGKLLLMQSEPATYLKIHGSDLGEADTIHLRERQVLGYDHAVLGAHVLKTWGLPDPIPQAVALHHQPVRAQAAGGDVALLVSLIRLAVKIDRMLVGEKLPTSEQSARLAATSECDIAGYSAKDLDKIWPELQTVKQEAMQLFR